MYFLLPLFLLSAVGIIDSFIDGEGIRLLGMLPIILPGVMAGVNVLSVIWKNNLKLTEPILNFTFSAFLIALPLIIFNLILLNIIWLFPTSRELLESFSRHSWWPGSIILQSLNITLAGYFMQLLGTLMTMLVIVVPVLSITHPSAVTLGSNLEWFNGRGKINWMAVSVYFGLSSFILGFIIPMTSNPFDIIEDASGVLSEGVEIDVFESVRQVLGAFFLTGGIMLMLVPIIAVIIIITKNSIRK